MMRKLILGTASVLALGIGGAALDFAADADDVSNAAGTMSSAPELRIIGSMPRSPRKTTFGGRK